MEDADYLVRLQPKEKTYAFMESQQRDIDWLGLEYDDWVFQSDLLEETKKFLSLHKEIVIYEEDELYFKMPLVIRMGTDWLAIPYVPQQTAERVYMDYKIGTTHVIRGDDFVTELSLYSYFCQQFGFPIPDFVFLPRLAGMRGDISKTHGGYKIEDFRNEGWSPEKLKFEIAKACLLYPKNGFELYNIKSNPRINL
jgi:glutamyl/glutaminyl-tRNA synthetase